MTDFFTETFTDWDRQAAERTAAEYQLAEKQRHGIARLLSVRGQQAAAAILVMSTWRTEPVEERWDSELCRGVLSVPPEGFDAVDDDVRAVISAAARPVIGEGFVALAVEVRLEDVEPGWIRLARVSSLPSGCGRPRFSS